MSTHWAGCRICANGPLPGTCISLVSVTPFRRAISSRKSDPSAVVVSAHTSPTDEEVTTYLCLVLIRPATGSSGSVTCGQCDANESYVLRPSNSAPQSSNQRPTAWPHPSSHTDISQPPLVNPPRVSSSGPPGA